MCCRLTAASLALFAVAAEPAGVEFFEKHVRPVLAEHCYSCHGPKKQQAGLRLDGRDAAFKGGDTGPVIAPGKPDASSLVAAVRYAGDTQMPPRGKLPEKDVAALAEWVRMGAPWPDDARPATSSTSLKIADPSSHWAFRPPADPAPPAVADAGWCRSPLDRFVLARQEAAGVRPAPEADRRTLARRLTLALTGLPPAYDDVRAFVNDPSPDAYERLVERLLASPHFGEAWGRHWLDVARYADNKGYVFQESRDYPFAYTYRDYVVRAFNEDRPYDRFVVEQLAADRVAGDDKRPLAAMGFLTVGRRFLNNAHDIIDDRIDVVTRGLLGLTVSCARCHDHKFDPVPARDYYGLYGVFASSHEPKELPPLGGSAGDSDGYRAEKRRREAALAAKVAELHAARVREFRKPEQVAAYLLAWRNSLDRPEDRIKADLKKDGLNPLVLRRWKEYLAAAAARRDPAWRAWLALARAPAEGFADRAARVLADPAARAALPGKTPATPAELARAYADAIAAASGGPLRAALDGPPAVPPEMAEQVLNRDDRNRLAALREKLAEVETRADAPPRAMVMLDNAEPVQQVVFLRGNPANRGPAAPRRFLTALAGDDPPPFKDGSGRLELARAIASKDNPLTARVLVNRVWAWHFGTGLVRTPSDFGLRSDPPTHPELLDWLATRFVRSGWSVKQLHRDILLSSTYRQAAGAGGPKAAELLAGFPRRRLEFEPLRDSLLAAAGVLDRRLGGPARTFEQSPRRRSLYGYVDRQNLPGLLRAFDFATPDAHAPQRFTTTVPQQALFLLNSPFVADRARDLAARAGGVRGLFRSALARDPSAAEAADAAGFLRAAGPDGPARLAQVLVMSNEFAFVD